MKYSVFIILLAIFSLSACQPNTDTPTQVTKKYWQALKNNDLTTATELVSKNSQSDLSRYFALPTEEKMPLREIYLGEEHATVTTIIRPEAAAPEKAFAPQPDDIPEMKFETILIWEDGQWKVDAARTQAPLVTKPTEPAHEEPFSDLDTAPMSEALQESAEMLNQLMREGSKEMSETFLEGMNKMNEALREAIDKMKQRHEQQEQLQPPDNDTDDAGDEGVI